MTVVTLPRGFRNRNPGNLRHGAPWDGLAAEQPDPAFCTFVDMEHGVRAMAKLLLNYERHFESRGQTCCVANIISRWAPAVENDTLSYASDVARRLAVGLTTPLDLSDLRTLRGLCLAIAHHENGCELDWDTATAGVKLALGTA